MTARSMVCYVSTSRAHFQTAIFIFSSFRYIQFVIHPPIYYSPLMVSGWLVGSSELGGWHVSGHQAAHFFWGESAEREKKLWNKWKRTKYV